MVVKWQTITKVCYLQQPLWTSTTRYSPLHLEWPRESQYHHGRGWELLHQVVGGLLKLTFISYENTSIRGGLMQYFLECECRSCMLHMSKNFVKQNRGRGLDYYFNKVTATFNTNEKDQYLERLTFLSPRSYKWLDDRSELTWRRDDTRVDGRSSIWLEIFVSLNNAIIKMKLMPHVLTLFVYIF